MQEISQAFTGRRIVLGVTGGIAAYKSADLVRRLIERGAEVRVVMTAGAQEFVTPLTFQAISARAVHTKLLDPSAEAAMGHIELARWAELILVAPATANFMARLAAGLADDLLSTLCLASAAPTILAPAMNQQMWAHPSTEDNRQRLQERGVRLLGPASGDQACGDIGPGRMLEPLDIIAAIEPEGTWKEVRVMITAGPTYEDLDPVRYLGNRSSGRMGFALAAEAAAMGARVTLVAGPVQRPTPPGVDRIDVRSALEMREAVMANVASTEVFIAAAAVADYRPLKTRTEKIKKGDNDRLSVEFERNPDILAEVAGLSGHQPLTVGFAAETCNVVEYARRKLNAKGIDMIAANHVGDEEGGFDCDNNALEVLFRGGEASIPMMSKTRVARRLLALIDDYRKRDARKTANG